MTDLSLSKKQEEPSITIHSCLWLLPVFRFSRAGIQWAPTCISLLCKHLKSVGTGRSILFTQQKVASSIFPSLKIDGESAEGE